MTVAATAALSEQQFRRVAGIANQSLAALQPRFNYGEALRRATGRATTTAAPLAPRPLVLRDLHPRRPAFERCAGPGDVKLLPRRGGDPRLAEAAGR